MPNHTNFWRVIMSRCTVVKKSAKWPTAEEKLLKKVTKPPHIETESQYCMCSADANARIRVEERAQSWFSVTFVHSPLGTVTSSFKFDPVCRLLVLSFSLVLKVISLWREMLWSTAHQFEEGFWIVRCWLKFTFSFIDDVFWWTANIALERHCPQIRVLRPGLRGSQFHWFCGFAKKKNTHTQGQLWLCGCLSLVWPGMDLSFFPEIENENSNFCEDRNKQVVQVSLEDTVSLCLEKLEMLGGIVSCLASTRKKFWWKKVGGGGVKFFLMAWNIQKCIKKVKVGKCLWRWKQILGENFFGSHCLWT